MIMADVPFDKMGIKNEVGEQIAAEVSKFMQDHPQKNIDIQKISDSSGYTRTVVKRILYILLGLRYLKATFVPIHSICGKVIGSQEISVNTVNEKVGNEEYFCVECRELIYEPQDIQIQVLFWEPGTNVE